MHSNKEERLCCDICVIILCFIYFHNPISDAHIIYGSTTLLTNIATVLILEITEITLKYKTVIIILCTKLANTKEKIVKRVKQLCLLKHVPYHSVPIFSTTTCCSNEIAEVYIFKELG